MVDKGDEDAGWIFSCVKRKQALATGIAGACFFVVPGAESNLRHEDFRFIRCLATDEIPDKAIKFVTPFQKIPRYVEVLPYGEAD